MRRRGRGSPPSREQAGVEGGFTATPRSKNDREQNQRESTKSNYPLLDRLYQPLSSVLDYQVIRCGGDNVAEVLNLIWTNFWKVFLPLGAIVGLSWALYSAATHIVRLDTRLEIVENQLRLLATSPAIVRTPEDRNLYTKENGGTIIDGYIAEPIPNPLITTCIDLVKRAAAAREKGDPVASVSLESYLRDFGCAAALKATTK